jgi:hypothetical protein
VAELKLPKLPDRTPVKLTVSVTPELSRGLHDYGAAYEATYGKAESVVDLIPFMLQAFLDSDRWFARNRSRS